MSEWDEVEVGDLCRIKHGHAFKGAFFEDDGCFLVLSPGNFLAAGGLQLRDGKETFYSGEFSNEYLLEEGDLVIAMTDLKQEAPILGSVLRIPESGRFLHNQRLGLVHDIADEVDRDFLYYLLNDQSVRWWLRATATGSTVRHTAPERIYRAKVRLPPIAVQEAIGASLRALDDLTENNRRRIEILEETARLLYREWFVHFRFPDHEDAELVDSDLGLLPLGWKARRLGEILELSYGKALRAGDRRGGPVAVYGSGGQVGWHDRALVTGPGIVVGRKGNVGSVYWSDRDFFPIDTTYYVESAFPLRFLEQLLRTLKFIDSHAAVPGLSRDQAYGLVVAEPDGDLLSLYETAVRPMYGLRQILSDQTAVLRDARDLLLPRLVSGELDVSELDLGLVAG